MLSDGWVLLISDDDEQYGSLRQYGFENVDRFRSVAIANKYFEEHPKQLKKYSLVFSQSRSFDPDFQYYPLYERLRKLEEKKVLRYYTLYGTIYPSLYVTKEF